MIKRRWAIRTIRTSEGGTVAHITPQAFNPADFDYVRISRASRRRKAGRRF